LGIKVDAELHVSGISNNEESGSVKRLLFFVAVIAFFGLTSCGAPPASTAITCTTTTSTSSTSTATSTCTDPVTNISVTISPATVSVSVATAQPFSDYIQGGTNSVTIWQVNSITGGNDTLGRIDSNGLYRAPSVVPSPNTVTVGAVSFEDQKLSATSTLTITPAPTVTITSPAGATTIPSGTANTLNFAATEAGGTTNSVFWYVGPVGDLGILGGNSTFGTINSNGVYSAPLTPPIGQTVSVTAVAQDSPSSSSAPLPVTISGYTTSSLQGRFAFSIAGKILSGPSAGTFYRAGSFSADGAGNLTGGLEDINETTGITPGYSFSGTYTVAADGRGTLKFNDSHAPASLASSNFDFVLVNGNELQITGFDASVSATYPGTATGHANAQDASTFTGVPLSALSGAYVFDFSGVHGSNGLSQIGEFTADGEGHITGGSIDINDGGTLSQYLIAGTATICSPAPTSLSTYSLGSNGRGTMTLTTVNASTCFAGPTFELNFYVVSRGSAKFVGTDTTLQVAGFTFQQTSNFTFNASALRGNYAFVLAGSSASGPIATAGSFLADGSGHLTSGVLDENVNGTPASNVPFVVSGSYAGTYSVASNGRGTVTFTTASRPYTLIFYLGPVGSNTTAVLQETDSSIASIASDGLFTQQQSAAFSLASIQGNYAIQTSGISGASSQVSTGELAADGAGKVTAGSVDVNTAGTLASALAVTGSYVAPSTAGRSPFILNSVNYAAYVVSPTQAYVLGTQSGQLAVGAILRRF